MTDYYCDYIESRVDDLDNTILDILHLDSDLAVLLQQTSFDTSYNLPASARLPSKAPTRSWQMFQEQGTYHTRGTYRILLHLLIINILGPDMSSYPKWMAQFDSSTSVIRENQKDVLARTRHRIGCAVALLHNDETFDPLSPPLGISHAPKSPRPTSSSPKASPTTNPSSPAIALQESYDFREGTD